MYVTSTRLFVLGPQMMNYAGQMGADVVREFIDRMDTIPDAKEVDILVHSTGGDPLAAWKLRHPTCMSADDRKTSMFMAEKIARGRKKK